MCPGWQITERMELLAKLVGAAVGIAIAGVFILAIVLALWAFWNFALAPIFGWPAATFWQVLIICVALRIVKFFIRGK